MFFTTLTRIPEPNLHQTELMPIPTFSTGNEPVDPGQVQLIYWSDKGFRADKPYSRRYSTKEISSPGNFIRFNLTHRPKCASPI